MPRRKIITPTLQRETPAAVSIDVARLLAGIRARRVYSCMVALGEALRGLDLETLERVTPHLEKITAGCSGILEELGA